MTDNDKSHLQAESNSQEPKSFVAALLVYLKPRNTENKFENSERYLYIQKNAMIKL